MAMAASNATQRRQWDLLFDLEDDLMPMSFFALADEDWLAALPPVSPKRSAEPVQGGASGSALQEKAPSPKRQRRAKVGAGPAEQDDSARKRALAQWAGIVERIAGSCQPLHSGPLPDEAELADQMSLKRTGTLLIRASSWRLFLNHASGGNIDTHSLDEADIYKYLTHLKKSGAPASRASAFIQACGFAYGICGFKTGALVMASSRCRGAAAQCLLRKRARRQRDPFKAAWVMSMEVEVFLTAFATEEAKLTAQEAIVAGFILFLTHARLRCSDGARISSEPQLDEAPGDDEDLQSFIEAALLGSQMKTGNTREKNDVVFPAVGLSKGLTGTDWAAAWLALRLDNGLAADLDLCLMPKPITDGTFAEGRIEPGQLTEWIRFILEKLGVHRAELTNIGSHSCKATLLSMSAKAGMAKDLRRTLGMHAVPGDKSVDAYSRDNMSAPLRELAKLLRIIRQGQFDPDSTRSGRWLPQEGPSAKPTLLEFCRPCGFDLGERPCFRCECGLWQHCGSPCSPQCELCGEDFCGECEASHDHECEAPLADDLVPEEAILESEADSDDVAMALEQEETELQKEETAKAEFLQKGASKAEEAEFPKGGIILNKLTDVAHKAGEDCRPACGSRLSERNLEMHLSPEPMEGKGLCWRPGCAPWRRVMPIDSAELSDGFGDVSSDGEPPVSRG